MYWIAAYGKVACRGMEAAATVTEKRKAYFLQFHDGKTDGIPCIFLCFKCLPVRFTDSLRRDVGSFDRGIGRRGPSRCARILRDGIGKGGRQAGVRAAAAPGD